jgi:hypothetical protein
MKIFLFCLPLLVPLASMISTSMNIHWTIILPTNDNVMAVRASSHQEVVIVNLIISDSMIHSMIIVLLDVQVPTLADRTVVLGH